MLQREEMNSLAGTIERLIESKSDLRGFEIKCHQGILQDDVTVMVRLNHQKEGGPPYQFGIAVSMHLILPFPMTEDEAVKETLHRMGPDAVIRQMDQAPGQLYIAPEVQQEMKQSWQDFETRIDRVAREVHYRMHLQQTQWEIEKAVDDLSAGSRELLRSMRDDPYILVSGGLLVAQAEELGLANLVTLRDGAFMNAVFAVTPNERTSYALEYLRRFP